MKIAKLSELDLLAETIRMLDEKRGAERSAPKVGFAEASTDSDAGTESTAATA
jgi:hypothetical protein